MTQADLARLLDLEEIRSLVARYCICVDARDWDGLRQILAPTASLELNGEPAATAGLGVADYIASRITTLGTSHHVTANHVTFHSDDEASGVWHMHYVTEGQDGNWYGVYRNDFRRLDDGWKLTAIRRDNRFWHSGSPKIVEQPPAPSERSQ